ncbi:TPA: hypothetical protein ACSTNG_001705 [Serratia fonticola]
MNAQDYTDIISLCDKAINMLNDFFSNNREMDLSAAKEVAFIFMDGKKLRADVLDAIPVPMRTDFARCVTHISGVYAYSVHPRKNAETMAIYKNIAHIKKVSEYMVKKLTPNTKATKIFYSWQLSTQGKYNNYFIRDCLRSAVQEINQSIPIDERDQDESINIEIDSDTQGASGSPHIFSTILNKIDTSTLFIVDVSIVSKKICNSNVMLELGYAIKALGFNNIIMVFNTALGSIDDLPFDLRSQRVSTYSFKEGDDKKQVNKHLTSLLKKAISTALQ